MTFPPIFLVMYTCPPIWPTHCSFGKLIIEKHMSYPKGRINKLGSLTKGQICLATHHAQHTHEHPMQINAMPIIHA